MKRLLAGLSLLFTMALMLVGINTPRTHASTQDFLVTNFTADYHLSRNERQTSVMRVDETIQTLFPNYDQNHGILRALPETYQGHTVSLELLGVTNDTGQPLKYSTSHDHGNLVLKIGDANQFVHGAHTYKISYQMKNVIAQFSDHQELYWDVNGDQWQQTITDAVANVHIPNELKSALQDRQQCFMGTYGGTQQNCTSTRQSNDQETIATFTAHNVRSQSTLTFVMGFQQGTFVPGPEIAAAQRAARIRMALKILAFLAAPILVTLFMYTRWRKFGRDPKGRGVIVPQYQPPKGSNVLANAYVLNEGLPTSAISAGIIELAVQRYIDISEVKTKKLVRTNTDYELELIKDPSTLAEEQRKVIEAFFGAAAPVGSKVLLSSLKNKLSSDVSKIDKALGTLLTAKGYFAIEPSKAKSKYAVPASLLLVVGFLSLYTGNLLLILVSASLIVSGIIMFIFDAHMPARTVAGVELRDYLLGLKEFIKVVEEKRFEYLQSPEGAEKTGYTGDPKNAKQKVKLFEQLLPYAMVFGLEKEWAKEFADIYPEPPSWYHGNYSTFNTAYLMSSIGGISTASNVAFTAPASSSSSGFGGGGFSGGGGGGGGGGGW